jgi:hypothetical protein
MKVLYELTTSKKPKVKAWLDNVLIVIDPCLNPDGRERFVNWYKQAKGNSPTIDSNALEHNQPWPNGRFNHYFFDLNRDWSFLTQKESQQRIIFYRKVMPQIHIDFHEMSIESPYFFGPSVQPFHQAITNWQKEFQKIAARNSAKHFDRNSWLYFSRETFDMLYPGYGDTWPTFNGAIGLTYEQGGSKKAGLVTQLKNGNMLTLNDRLEHHFVSSLAIIETAFMNKEKLLNEFEKYFKTAVSNPKGKYKTYLIKNKNRKSGEINSKIKNLLNLLDKQGVQYYIIVHQAFIRVSIIFSS